MAPRQGIGEEQMRLQALEIPNRKPSILTLYRRRNRCLMLHWSEGGRLHFQYSPLRRHRTDPDEEFRRLGSVPVGIGFNDQATQLVNGVVCSGEIVNGDMQLDVISVCTGQSLRIPQPFRHESGTWSSYHLGYDPKTKRYKLLRVLLIHKSGQMKAEILILGPTGTVWEWRKLDDEAAGIRKLPLIGHLLHHTVLCSGVLMFPGDGFLCWNYFAEGLILFDLNKEVFRWVKLPPGIYHCWTMLVPRVVLDDDRLAIFLWVVPVSRRDGINLNVNALCWKMIKERFGGGRVWNYRQSLVKGRTG